MRCLRCQLFRWLVQLGRVELRKVARYALLQLGAAPFHLPACEVLVAGIDRLELAAVDRNTRRRPQTHQATQFNKLNADLLDRSPAVLAEVGNRLVVRSEPAGQPHDLDIAPSLSLKPPARLNPIEIAVDVELQQDRRMIRRPARRLGSHSFNPNLDKSSLSTKASITRTGLFSSIQSARHSGNSVACPRSIPSTKRLIRSLRTRITLRE